MPETPPPALPPWLRFLVICSLSCTVFAASLVGAAHTIFGEMRPLNGVFVKGVGLLAVVVALLVAGHSALCVMRRKTG